MAMTRHSIIGVFDEPAMAERAIEALQSAGFRSDHIHSPGHHASGSFFAGLKSMFTGEDAHTGTLAGDLTGMGVSDEEAHYYENEFQAGHAIVAVQADGREQEAMDLLHTNGAYNYGMRYGAPQPEISPAPASTMQTTETGETRRTAGTNEERTLRLREEQLGVNKRRVQTGEVALRKEIVEEQKTINVPVSHEEVYIERRPVTDATVDDTTPIGQGETIHVPLSEEKVHVSKDTMVTGEVSIGKRAVEETQQMTETVRREEAHIEQQGDAPIHGTKSDRFHPNSGNEDPLL